MNNKKFQNRLFNLDIGENLKFQDNTNECTYIAECFYRNDVKFILVTEYGAMISVYQLSDYHSASGLAHDVLYDFGISDDINVIENDIEW